MAFDLNKIREEFPLLSRKVYGKPLIYLDNAATAQKPRVVIETIDRLYREENANIHRGVHHLSERCTELYEEAFKKGLSGVQGRRPCKTKKADPLRSQLFCIMLCSEISPQSA
jgi:hypothetical protein